MGFRHTAVGMVLLLVLGACTATAPEHVGTPLIEDASGESNQPGDAAGGDEGLGEDLDVPGDAQDLDAEGSPSGDTGGASTEDGGTSTSGSDGGGSTTTGGSTTSGTSSGSTSTGGTSNGGSGGGGDQSSAGPPEADLFDDRTKSIGITADQIRLCGHAALIFADAFDVRPEDLNVYWRMMNDAGGVHGRSVSVNWKDDAYSPDSAVRAAESCRSENPFFLIGGIGFDQIPAVRNWAERNKMLYLHHIAVAPGTNLRYSFSYQPTVDATGRAFGQHIARHYKSKDIGIIWRQSENWEPGHRNGLATMKQHGVKVVADLPVSNGQGVYSQQIAALQSSGAEVVWIWENALAAAQIINQADAQGYRPKWVVFPFQTTLDVIGDRGLNPSMDGVATWSAYAPGGYGNAYPGTGYAEEIKRFEAAYAKYRPNTKPNDLLWQVWVGNKGLHDLFERCGRDCNRNRIAGIWLSGLKTTLQASCTADFGREGSFGNHIGGYQFLAQETFRHRSGGPAWKTNRWCSESLL